MQVPTWGKVIGALMIFFGGCSVLNDVQMLAMPDKLSEKREELNRKIEEDKAELDSLETASTDSTTAEQDTTAISKKKKGIEMAEKILNMPEHTKTWMMRFAYIGILVSLLYAVAGVFLLRPQRFSIMLAYGALIVSIAVSGVQAVVLTSDGADAGIIALTSGASQLLSIVIDIVLLSVIFASDKEAYREG